MADLDPAQNDASLEEDSEGAQSVFQGHVCPEEGSDIVEDNAEAVVDEDWPGGHINNDPPAYDDVPQEVVDEGTSWYVNQCIYPTAPGPVTDGLYPGAESLRALGQVGQSSLAPGDTSLLNNISISRDKIELHTPVDRLSLLVNPANLMLSNGAGAALAIRKAAGPDYQSKCRALVRKYAHEVLGGLLNNEVYWTGAYLLSNRYGAVANLVVPFREGHYTPSQCERVLYGTYASLFRAVRVKNTVEGRNSPVVMTLLGCGTYGYDLSASCRALCRAYVDTGSTVALTVLTPDEATWTGLTVMLNHARAGLLDVVPRPRSEEPGQVRPQEGQLEPTRAHNRRDSDGSGTYVQLCQPARPAPNSAPVERRDCLARLEQERQVHRMRAEAQRVHNDNRLHCYELGKHRDPITVALPPKDLGTQTDVYIPGTKLVGLQGRVDSVPGPLITLHGADLRECPAHEAEVRRCGGPALIQARRSAMGDKYLCEGQRIETVPGGLTNYSRIVHLCLSSRTMSDTDPPIFELAERLKTAIKREALSLASNGEQTLVLRARFQNKRYQGLSPKYMLKAVALALHGMPNLGESTNLIVLVDNGKAEEQLRKELGALQYYGPTCEREPSPRGHNARQPRDRREAKRASTPYPSPESRSRRPREAHEQIVERRLRFDSYSPERDVEGGELHHLPHVSPVKKVSGQHARARPQIIKMVDVTRRPFAANATKYTTDTGLEWSPHVVGASQIPDWELPIEGQDQLIADWYPATPREAYDIESAPTAQAIMSLPQVPAPWKGAYMTAGYDLMRERAVERDRAVRRVTGSVPGLANGRGHTIRNPSPTFGAPRRSSTPRTRMDVMEARNQPSTSGPAGSECRPTYQLRSSTVALPHTPDHAHSTMGTLQPIDFKELEAYLPIRCPNETITNYVSRCATKLPKAMLDTHVAAAYFNIKLDAAIPEGFTPWSVLSLWAAAPGENRAELAKNEIIHKMRKEHMPLSQAMALMEQECPGDIMTQEQLLLSISGGSHLAASWSLMGPLERQNATINYDRLAQILDKKKQKEHGDGQKPQKQKAKQSEAPCELEEGPVEVKNKPNRPQTRSQTGNAKGPYGGRKQLKQAQQGMTEGQQKPQPPPKEKADPYPFIDKEEYSKLNAEERQEMYKKQQEWKQRKQGRQQKPSGQF